ncbi:Transmembrane protein 8B, partial [Linum grandiflorum]
NVRREFYQVTVTLCTYSESQLTESHSSLPPLQQHPLFLSEIEFSMAGNSILRCCCCRTILLTSCMLLLLLSSPSCTINAQQLDFSDTMTVSSLRYPQTRVKPYDLRYIRVELPPWFSSVSIAVDSDVQGSKASKSTSPIICLRDGSPPLPDVLNSSVIQSGPLSSAAFESIQGSQNVDCFPMQKNLTVKVTNEQVSPGVWYLGAFNGIGATRAQSKMIVRRSDYSFSANISVDGCITTTMWGQYCNQTIYPLSCSLSNNYRFAASLLNVGFIKTQNAISCDDFGISCHEVDEQKVFSLDVMDLAEELSIMARNISANSNDDVSVSHISLMCYARNGAMPSVAVHDYSIDLEKAPLVINSPKLGRWFFSIIPTNLGRIQDNKTQICYSIRGQVFACPSGMAGPNCTFERHTLETVLRKDSNPFESYYLPVHGAVSSETANFPLDPFSNKSSDSIESNNLWTYFVLDLPRGAAGSNIHIHITSDTKINYEIYAKVSGSPSLDRWDYYYANSTSNSNSSMFFMLYDSSEQKVDFYILYVKEGIWTFGLRRLNISSTSSDQTLMAVSVERCPRKCSSHGECKVALDASGLTSYSFCACDRTHGGFDCGIEIVSHRGHVRQSIALIASNAAAVFPAIWALRQRAFAEWVLFTSSGISSGLYHACDVGTWCALSYNVLQFMDFWLSFMAVVSTFVYLATIDEVFKRTIHTVVAIVTALMAITKATRWQTMRRWLDNLIKTVWRRFQWGFLIAGFVALALAAVSWTLESSETYWIWHSLMLWFCSLWHVAIYTSSFLFLCSKANAVSSQDEGPADVTYSLTRQDSSSRREA